MTYAGNLANLKDIEVQPNYTFVKAYICDFERIIQLFKQYNIDSVIHLAAESHVDRSIKDPFIFAQTNVMGTLSLLQAAKLAWETSETGYDHKLFYHISTDEVYGALDFDGTFFTEQTKYQTHSPYSATKAYVLFMIHMECLLLLPIAVTITGLINFPKSLYLFLLIISVMVKPYRFMVRVRMYVIGCM